MDKKIGIALIGYGGMGQWHGGTLKKLDGFEIKGTYDIDPARMEAAREQGIARYGSLEELLADEAVAVVTIATPNDTHLPLALAAMEAGKHVVCEKPAALNSLELRQMIDAAKEHRVLFTVHQNRRWDEDFHIVKKLYGEGTLGPIFHIESRVHGSRGIPGDWRNTKEHGGGMVLDWGVHLIDQMDRIMAGQKLSSVWARLGHVTNDAVDDGFCAEFCYEDGCTWTIEVGTSNFIALPRWYVQGENGTAVVKDWDLSGEIVMVSDWEKKDAVPVVTAAGLTKTMAPRTDETIQHFPLPTVQADVLDFYRNVGRAVKGTEALLVQPAQVMAVMKIMEAIFASAEYGRVVKF